MAAVAVPPTTIPFQDINNIAIDSSTYSKINNNNTPIHPVFDTCLTCASLNPIKLLLNLSKKLSRILLTMDS